MSDSSKTNRFEVKRPQRIITRYPSLRELYPGGSSRHADLANVAFRLGVFREDMHLELALLSQDSIEALDRGDALVRKIYATRRAALTLVEASAALNSAVVDNFIRDGKAQSFLRDLCRHRRIVRRDVRALSKTRNQAAAHLDERLVRKILDEHPDLCGRISIGVLDSTATRYNLPVHALLTIYIDGAQTNQVATGRLVAFLSKMRSAHEHAVQALDCFFCAYTTEIDYWKLAR